MNLRHLVGATALAAAALSGCGGSNGGGSAQLRLVNATASVASADLYTSVDSTTYTQQSAAVAQNGAGSYISLGAGTYTLKVTNHGDSASLSSGSRSLSSDGIYSAVAWGKSGATAITLLTENSEAAPATGNAKVRIFNAAPDAGALDMYVTVPTADLASAAAASVGTASGQVGGFYELAAGSYRLRITGSGSKSDLRLDLPALALNAQDVVTVILEPGAGGVLVNALALAQQGAATALPNTQARARLIAGVQGNAAVSASIGAASLAFGLPSPSVASYTLVPAGSQAVDLVVNNVPVSTATPTLAAGGDYTLLVDGTASAPQLNLIADDNTLPSSTSAARMRLVNGAAGLGALTLAVDFTAVANNVAYGTASDFGTVASDGAASFSVTSPTTATPVYTNGSTTVAIQGLGVYTMFILDGGPAAQGVLRKDR